MAFTLKSPTNAEEYIARFQENNPRDQTGDLIRQPCHFCAAPDFMVYRMADTKRALGKGATCGECGRSAKARFTKVAANKWDFQIVQTGGEDPPSWLPGAPIPRA